MKSAFDSERIEIPCPHCGHKFSELLGKLKTEPKIACASCGGVITFDASNLNAGLKQADKALADFNAAISSFGKKR